MLKYVIRRLHDEDWIFGVGKETWNVLNTML